MKLFKNILTITILSFSSVAVLANTSYEEITWEHLIPEGAIQPEEYSLDDLHRLDEIMEEQQENADIVGRQVVTEMAGKKVKLPAYIVPLESDVENFKEFLLVPYFGACIHVPPPPPNQTVFGVHKEGIKSELFDALYVYGTLQIESIDSELAEAGYSMKVEKVEPINWDEFFKKQREQE